MYFFFTFYNNGPIEPLDKIHFEHRADKKAALHTLTLIENTIKRGQLGCCHFCYYFSSRTSNIRFENSNHLPLLSKPNNKIEEI